MKLALLLALLALAACASTADAPPLTSPTDPSRAQSSGPSSGVDMQAPADDE